MAAPAWTMPEAGLALPDEQKQAYQFGVMEGFRHPGTSAEAKALLAPYRAPDGWIHEKLVAEGVPMERLDQPGCKDGPVVLQLHGGGYVGPLSNLYRRAAEKYAVLTGAKSVYMVDYRLAPKHVYPAALEDAVAAYRHVLASGSIADKIILTGDSAGGNLALALMLELKKITGLIRRKPRISMRGGMRILRYH